MPASTDTTVMSAPPPGAGEEAVVAGVSDGDTLWLTDGRRVRLLQIDAPELHHDCHGEASLSALLGLTPEGTRIRMVVDPQLDRRDSYGRLLRYVFVGSRNVNVALVRRGAASPYFFREQRGRYASSMLDAVEEARAARRGYWGACRAAEIADGTGEPRLRR